MSKHLQRDLDGLKREILSIGSMVEESITRAIHSLDTRRLDLAEEVIAGDREIDEREVHVEDECLKILALHQPVAADLRFVVAVLKVNNDLERMGDLAVNIAKRSKYLAKHESLESEIGLEYMGQQVNRMVRQSLDALVRTDVVLARRIMDEDEEIDELHRKTYKTVRKLLKTDPNSSDVVIQWLSVSKHLERISDLATNIAEDVIFLVDGEIVRHGMGPSTI
jgi:phosphate transport system protein